MNDMTPVAYLLHGGRLFQDRASTHLVHAEKDQKDRNDGSKIEPLFRQSEVEFADSERQSQIRGLEIALCGYADEVDQLTARNAELEAEVARLQEAWAAMTEEARRIQHRHLDKHDGDVYHAMQSLASKFGFRDNKPVFTKAIARNALKETGL